MPSKKRKSRSLPLFILFAIFLAMLGMVFLLNKDDSEQTRVENGPFFKNFDRGQVSRILIQRPPSEMVHLVKTDKQWLVDTPVNYPADDSLIEKAFNILSSLSGGTLVSQNPEKQEEMGVSDASGLAVTFFKEDGEVVLDFFLGNRGPIFQSQYVRMAGKNEVYLFPVGLDFYFDKAEWRDKSILNILPDDMSEFAIKSPSGKMAYVRSDAQWKIKKDDGTLEAVPDVEKVNSLVTDISGLSGLSFAENDAASAIDFENRADATKLWVKTRQDAVYTVYFVRENDTVYAKRADGIAVFTIGEAAYDALLNMLLF